MVGTPPPKDPGWGHIPALDGVRGVAVAVVLLFHGGVGWARGGFLGVDAFFVLSGLLITSLLLDEVRREGAIDLGRFWARRARRLFPALLAVVAAAGLYGALIATPDALRGLRLDALATLAYVANWRYVAAGADYFEVTAQPSVLRHTWSLAIEEQFYLAWPLVVFGLARTRARLSWIGGVAIGGVLASAIAMWVVHEPGQDPSRAYYGTDSRAQVVLMGAALAVGVAVVRRRGGIGRELGIVLGVAALLGAAAFTAAVARVEGSETALYRGGFFGLALAVAAVLAHIVLVPNGWSARALAWTPLRAAGRISYGLYLWHWPLYLTLTRERTGASGVGLLALRLVATTAVAVISYYVLELPIRQGALPRWRAGVALPVAAAVAVIAAVLGTMPPEEKAVASVAAPVAAGFPAPIRPPIPAGSPARVLVVGDSVAKTLAKRYERTARSYGLAITNAGVLGCGVVRGGPYRYFGQQRAALRACETWPDQFARHISRVDPDVVLLIVGRWEVMDRVYQGKWTHLGEPAFDRYIESELDRAFRVLSDGDAIVAVATAPYFLRGERPDGGRWPEDNPKRVDRFNQILRRVAARHPRHVAVLDLNERTSRGGRYTPVVDGVSLRFDGVHFSPEGARWLGPWLLGALSDMAPPSTGRPRPRPTVPTTRPRSSTSTSLPTRSSTTTSRPSQTTTTEDDFETTTTTQAETTTTTGSTTTLLPRP